MHIHLNAILLIIFFVMFNGIHSWCNICPKISSHNSTLCECEDAYYDELIGECVNYLDCSMVRSVLEIVNSSLSAAPNSVVSTLLTNAADSLAENNPNIILTNLTTAISALQLLGEHITEQSANDIEVINNIIKNKFLEVNNRFASDISPMFNPYVLGNKKFHRECKNKPFCLMRKVIMTHEKKLVNATALLLIDSLNQMVLALDDVHNYYSINCKSVECPIITIVVQFQDVLTDTLINLKQFGNTFGKIIVESLTNSRPVGKEELNNMLSPINFNKN